MTRKQQERNRRMTLEEKLQQMKKDMCNSLSNKGMQESLKASDICPSVEVQNGFWRL